MKTITDQKRVARGEHLRLAKYWLQARDAKHNGLWTIVMLAGPEAQGELTALRHLFPESCILVIDKNPEYLTGIDAEEVLHCDIQPVNGEPVPELVSRGRFDLMDLDLFSNANPTTREFFFGNEKLMAPRGVLIATFSYGRDVVPVAMERYFRFQTRLKRAWNGERRGYGGEVEKLEVFLTHKQIPEGIKARISYLFPTTLLRKLRSVIVYMGEHHPMCSVLFAGTATLRDISFVRLADEDFSNVVLNERDLGAIYDCPAERLLALRRSQRARKAVATARARRLNGAC